MFSNDSEFDRTGAGIGNRFRVIVALVADMLRPVHRLASRVARRSSLAVLMMLVVCLSNVNAPPSRADVPPGQVGAGFTVTASDLAYILEQIKIAEFHAANTTPATGLCGALLGSGPHQIASPLLSYGLRTVDGSCNNLQTGQQKYGAADMPFPRLTSPVFKDAEPMLFDPDGPGPQNAGDPTSYTQTIGAVFDSQPRMISNLIVDQTSTNPAAVFVAGYPARTQGNEGVVPCTTEPSAPGGSDGWPSGCVPAHQTLFIPNVTTDVGLSPPFNSLFTIFGQFFDHGLDKITNTDDTPVFVPLKSDDPLVAGPDHIFGNTDDLPPSKRFMVLSRGKIVPGADGHRNALNTDSPFVDQSQTYTSHASHQVFLREYTLVSGRPQATGKFLSEPDGGMAKWKTIKAQARNILGLVLVDVDVTNIPMVAADPYGNFIPGPNGLPQFVVANGTALQEGNLATPVAAPIDVVRIDTAFLNDIAHSAGPGCISPSGNCLGPKLPDGNNTVDPHTAPQASGEYDDELLGEHFICGDGRCNENIALTAIHQIFHMEHDRLVDDYTNLTSGVLTRPENAGLLAAYQAVNLTPGPNKTFTFRERIFQAARFVTEMQYQHLVFEEFARKIQPAINPFQPFAFNQTDLNPAITAEFAHAVYRLGHSMLNETIPRKNANGSTCAHPGDVPNSLECLNNDIPMLDGFLNPVEFYNGGTAGTLNSVQATSAIIMGLSDQVGNEIDEFVSDTLRNNLLGLPLDLPTLNLTRARSEGIPSLNNVRKQIHAATNDGQLAPYRNWFEFGQALKHEVSWLNFIAAYGTHPSITNLDPDGSGPIQVGSIAARRAAADQLINNTVLPGPDGSLGSQCNDPDHASSECADNIYPPSDRIDFLFSTNSWANAPDGGPVGVSTTGVDDIDLWVGGLAENTNLFGGLLGPTFNYVFEKQLTDLQNGDRFYYLARTPGMNLRSQLEGNSFAELVMRNVPAHTLKADPFATADCKFELANLHGTAADFASMGPVVANDPTTECDETALLVRLADGTIKYKSVNSIDPPGINGQGVYNGSDFADAFFGGNDNDTFWGGLGNDRIEGNGGDDVVLGGEGDDIITDSSGADILKGGPGNDAIDGGIGDDIIMSGSGKDFTNGGGNINETFSGPDDDFAIAGQGEDAVFGDAGNEWEEGGDQPDLLIGDSSSLFFDDHNQPGHDILIGQGGDDDYDMEGGDDIGVAGPGVEKNAGAAGWDWLIGQGDPQPQDMDLSLSLVGVPLPVNAVRDRFNEVEALSGWNLNDTLRGDSIIPSQLNGGGFIGCDALDADGVARIAGLDALVPASIRTVDSTPIAATSATNYCGLEGPVWGEGNILLGGYGSDVLEGRGANDILDGDRYLNVRLSVRNGSDGPDGVDTVTDGSGAEIGTTDLMENPAVLGNFGPATTGMTLQQAVFAGKVNPGNIVAVREILTPTFTAAARNGDCALGAAAVNCDQALFSGPESEYAITLNSTGDLAGSLNVSDLADPALAAPIAPAVPRATDGIDTLWNMEQLVFCDAPDPAVKGGCLTRAAPVPVQPLAQVTTGSLAFGSRIVNTQTVQTITVRNLGIIPLTIGAVSLLNPTDFQITGGTCSTGRVLTRNGPTCSVTVTFRPLSRGNKATSLVITHNPAGSQLVVPVSGFATMPVASLSSNALDFGLQNTGSTSATRTVVLTNTGDATLTINSIVLNTPIAGEFTRVNAPATSCGTSLTAGSSCNINLRFSPSTTGLRTGSFTLTSNSNGVLNTQQVVALTGTGVVQNPVASVSPSSLDFANVLIGSSLNRVITLSNTGTGTIPMSISGITVSSGGGFDRVASAVNNCGNNLAAGTTCQITVRFSATNALGGGAKTGLVTISDNSGNVASQQTVTLSGFAAVAAANDVTTGSAGTGTGTQNIGSSNVRANDTPSAGAGSTIAIVSSTFTNGGATATPSVSGNSINWALTPPLTATTGAARQASKRGTYTVTYSLTNGGASATATYTLTVN